MVEITYCSLMASVFHAITVFQAQDEILGRQLSFGE